MLLKDYKKDELELMAYDDLAYLILLEANKKMKINDLFRKVCKILKLDDATFENKIADFFELLSTDKKFIMLEAGFWDLREKHSQKIKIDDYDDDILEPAEKINEEEELNNEEDIFYETDETDDIDDDLNDLVIVDEENDSLG